MRIDELFDKPLPLSWKVESSKYTASFQIDDKEEFEIFFNKGIDGFGKFEWTVTFGLKGSKHYYNARKHPTSTSRDYKHKTVLVFSTVLEAINVFWEKENPPVLYYAASGDRQEKAYERIMKYFNAKNPEYHIERKYDRASDGEYYEITK